MDPGLQVYGGTIFKALRDEGDGIFLKLPPPGRQGAGRCGPLFARCLRQGRQPRGCLRGAPSAAPAPDMRAYYAGGGGGCFGPRPR